MKLYSVRVNDEETKIAKGWIINGIQPTMQRRYPKSNNYEVVKGCTKFIIADFFPSDHLSHATGELVLGMEPLTKDLGRGETLQNAEVVDCSEAIFANSRERKFLKITEATEGSNLLVRISWASSNFQSKRPRWEKETFWVHESLIDFLSKSEHCFETLSVSSYYPQIGDRFVETLILKITEGVFLPVAKKIDISNEKGILVIKTK